jgi:hypothetical protein
MTQKQTMAFLLSLLLLGGTVDLFLLDDILYSTLGGTVHLWWLLLLLLLLDDTVHLSILLLLLLLSGIVPWE